MALQAWSDISRPLGSNQAMSFASPPRMGRPWKNRRRSAFRHPVVALLRVFSTRYGSRRSGLNLEVRVRMIHVTHPPASDEPHPRTPNRDQVLGDLTLAQVEAIMCSLDQALTDAHHLRTGLAPLMALSNE